MLQESTLQFYERDNLLRRIAGRDGIPLDDILGAAPVRGKGRRGAHDRLRFLAAVADQRSDLRDHYLACARDLAHNHEQTYSVRFAGARALGTLQTSDTDILRLVTWVAGDSERGWDSLQAIELLYATGGEHRLAAVDFLERLARDADIWTQEEALTTLTRIEPNRCTEVTERVLELLERATGSEYLYVPSSLLQMRWQFGVTTSPRTVAALTQISGDRSAPVAKRTDAARALGRQGKAHREQAIRALQNIATDENLNAEERCIPAVELASWGEDARQNSVTVLNSLATDPRNCGRARRHAVSALRKLGKRAPELAFEALTGLVIDPDIELWQRIGAADELIDMGPQARNAAAEALNEMGGAPATPLQRALARSRVAVLDSRCAIEAAELLSTVAADGRLLPWERQVAAVTLLNLSPYYSDRAGELLAALSQETDHSLWERRQACEALARLGTSRKTLAVELLAECVTGTGERACAWEISEAADTLAELDVGRASEADALILSLGEDQSVSFGERAHALELLIRSDSPAIKTAINLMLELTASSDANAASRTSVLTYLLQRERSRARALGMLRDINRNPKVSEIDRLRAGAALFKIDHGLRESTLRSLRDIARDPSCAASERREAASMLVGQEPDDHRLAMSVLTTCAQDSAAHPIDRVRAWSTLSSYDQTQRYAAESAVARDTDALTIPDDVRRALMIMAEFDECHSWESLCRLRDIVVDHAVEPAASLRAAKDVALLINPRSSRVNGFAPPCLGIFS